MGLFARLFGRGRPAAQPARRRDLGHRGTGGRDEAGRAVYPDLANAASWGMIGADEVEDFIYGGQILFVQSSNVANFQYDRENQQMMVEYLDGSAYNYFDVTEDEAFQVVKAPSKGRVIWDLFRVRGSSTQHKKKFVQLR